MFGKLTDRQSSALVWGAMIVVTLIITIAILAHQRRRQKHGLAEGAFVPVPPSGDPNFPCGSPARWVCNPELRECRQSLWRAAGEPSYASANECMMRCGRENMKTRIQRMQYPDATNVFPYGRSFNGEPRVRYDPQLGKWFAWDSSPALTGDAQEDVSALLKPGARAEYNVLYEMAPY